MKVLVTGCAGFIGMHVALRLLARGDEVIGIDNLNDYYDVGLKRARLERLRHDAFAFHPLDIADAGALAGVHASERPARVVCTPRRDSRQLPPSKSGGSDTCRGLGIIIGHKPA